MVDAKNHIILPVEYKQIVPFGPGYAASKKDLAALFDASGKQVASGYSATIDFPIWNRLSKPGTWDRSFVYNSNDKKFHPYQLVAGYHVGYYTDPDRMRLFYKRNNKWGIMDTTGRELTPAFFDDFNREITKNALAYYSRLL